MTSRSRHSEKAGHEGPERANAAGTAPQSVSKLIEMTNRPRNSGFRISTVAQVILIASNLVLAAAVSFHVLKSEPSPAAHANELPIGPLETLDASVNRLTLTLQRFNTTSLQFEYLQKEIDRLGLLDQSLTKRISLEESKAPDSATEDAANGLKQLQTIQGQVRQELKHHRESIVRLIEGLERQLDSVTLANKAAEKVPPNPGESAPQSSEPVEPPAAGKLQE